MQRRLALFLLSAVVLAVTTRHARTQDKTEPIGFTLVDSSGNIRKPNAYRDRFQSLGSYTVLNAGGNDMHYSYATPGTAEAYRRTGKFPDGTVLVKEVFGTDHAQLSTGDAYWAKGTKIWFVMVKDDKGRYPGNPLWGDGWGWALYKADAPGKQVATNYKKDCLGCHQPAKGTDWIYVKGYPVLQAGK
jgi:Cytochrome P460